MVPDDLFSFVLSYDPCIPIDSRTVPKVFEPFPNFPKARVFADSEGEKAFTISDDMPDGRSPSWTAEPAPELEPLSTKMSWHFVDQACYIIMGDGSLYRNLDPVASPYWDYLGNITEMEPQPRPTP
jgi:hypothetical protein